MDTNTPSAHPAKPAGVAAVGDTPSVIPLGNGYSARLLSAPEQAEPFVPDWEDLCRHSLEANLFFQPWELLPAWQAFGDSRNRLLLLYSPQGRLDGLFPLRVRRGYRRIPIPIIAVWRHLHCPLGVPLIRSEAAPETLRALIEWLGKNPWRAQVMILDHLSADGSFSQALENTLNAGHRRWYEHDRWERAVIRPGDNADAYLERALATKRRRELRRLFNRLGEKGEIAFAELTAGDDLDRWLGDFFALEQAGWKGRGGTAIADRDSERRFFERIARTARERGQLMMLAMTLDGRPIAMKCNFLADGGGYAAKIAYDETYAQYSPGMQLELHHIRILHDRSDIPWMDSCAVPGHFMKERIWSERRPMRSLSVGIGFWGNILLAALPVAMAVRSRLKRPPPPGPSHPAT